MGHGLSKGKIAETGPAKTLVYLRLANGQEPARLIVEVEADVPDVKAFNTMFRVMATMGRLGKHQFKSITDWTGLFEFRAPRQARVLCWMDGRDIILADGEVKKQDKLSRSLLDRVAAWHGEWKRAARGRS